MGYNNLFTTNPSLDLNNSVDDHELTLRDMSNWCLGYDKTSTLKLGTLTKINTNQINLFGNMGNTGRVRGLYEFFSSQFTLGRIAGAVTTLTLSDGVNKWDITTISSGAIVATSGSVLTAKTLTLSSPDGQKWDITINSSGVLISTSGSSNPAVASITLKAGSAYWVIAIADSGALIDQASSSISSVIMCAKSVTDYSSGKMEYMSSSVWNSVKWTDGNDLNFLPYQMCFSQYFDSFRAVNTLYFCNGDTFSKFFTDITNTPANNANNQAVTLSDCNCNVQGVATSLTGTLTFTNGSKAVTGSGTHFTTELSKGRWIRRDATYASNVLTAASIWQEVAYVTSDTALTLREPAVIVTGAGSAGASETAPLTTLKPLFCITWMDKLWLLNLFNGPNGAIYSRLICSDTWSDATPWSLETFTPTVSAAYQSNTANFIDIRMTDVSYGTGMIGIGQYLFVFSENEYIVYQFNASVSPPLTEVQRFRYGCNSMNTLKRYGNSVIYFTGKELRITDGSNDVPLSNDIKDHVLYNADVNIMPNYFGLSPLDDKYPCGLLDTFNMEYKLYLNDISQTDVRFEYVYDLANNVWTSGPRNFYNTAQAIQTFSLNNTLTTGLTSSLILYMCPSAQQYLSSIAFNDTGTQVMGSIMTQDKFYGDVKSSQTRDFVELWVHVPVGLTVTFDFQFWGDGKAGYATPVQKTVIGNSVDQFSLLRFPSKVTCNYFRWQLRDIAYSGAGPVGSSITILAGDEKFTREEGK